MSTSNLSEILKQYKITREMEDYVKQHFQTDDFESIQRVILYLKNLGLSQLPTALLLVSAKGITFQEANAYVTDSDAWR